MSTLDIVRKLMVHENDLLEMREYYKPSHHSKNVPWQFEEIRQKAQQDISLLSHWVHRLKIDQISIEDENKTHLETVKGEAFELEKSLGLAEKLRNHVLSLMELQFMCALYTASKNKRIAMEAATPIFEKHRKEMKKLIQNYLLWLHQLKIDKPHTHFEKSYLK
ncbi:MAG: hypothetical protein HY399_00090 [Elusimicrobia bacterium]|nr:hypothetical protein [Elusimicrobiota bacterium]